MSEISMELFFFTLYVGENFGVLADFEILNM